MTLTIKCVKALRSYHPPSDRPWSEGGTGTHGTKGEHKHCDIHCTAIYTRLALFLIFNTIPIPRCYVNLILLGKHVPTIVVTTYWVLFLYLKSCTDLMGDVCCSGASRKIDSRPSRGAWGAWVARAPRSWGGGGSQTESGNPDDVFIQN